MKLFFDGWMMFLEHKESILILAVTLWGLGAGWWRLTYDGDEQHGILKILVILYWGSLWLIWISLSLILLGRLWLPFLTWGSVILPIVCMLSILISLFRRAAPRIDIRDSRCAFIFLAVVFLYSLMRLAFLADLSLPPYDDSPEHYLIVKDLLQLNADRTTTFYSLESITDNYYHMGFHSLSAWLMIASHSSSAMTMALLGQMFIVFSAVSVFLLTLVWTRSIPAAVVASLFAALAWQMPAFASNWGKYPALAGLALLPGWLGLLLLSQNTQQKRYMRSLLFVLIISGLGLLHTRLFICLAIIVIAWFLGRLTDVQWASRSVQTVVYICLTFSVSLLFLKPLSIFYFNSLFLPLGFLALLLPFAANSYPRFVLAISLSMLGIWVASRTPVFFGTYGTNWLDAPFVQLLLYIPLSLLGGLGFAAMSDRLVNNPKLGKLSFAIPVVITVLAFVSTRAFYPDECCNYVTPDDLAAIGWLQKNAPSDAVVWIPGYKPHKYRIGTDAGIWVFAFTGRNANKLDYDFEWSSVSAQSSICKAGYGVVYIYQGGQAFSFKDQELASARWLRPVFMAGNSKIYEANCPL